MFNLLVMGGGWGDRRDEISIGRIYITPEQQAEFKPGGMLNLNRLKSLPAIFAAETDGDPTQVARVCEITSARINGENVAIEYRYDLDVPPSFLIHYFCSRPSQPPYQTTIGTP
ncbi:MULTISPECIES: hypothetical protein [unclassified Pseudomonas]|uniref:hypothetical protein n=1 Tax=unclassified Pseudomonas TaxID=196821 RepID=UPI0008E58922|nr:MULTISPECIES: hypothetical protein [unclassified Pseudomonas]SFP86743.1 hypothetical protein SAMN03159315_05052 [Pseudomonas sp. NFPP28]